MLQAATIKEVQAPPSCFERLFLLELMVHEVCYDCAATMDQNFLNTLGPTVITFSSDSFPPLEMSEDEFGVCPPFESLKVRFKSGKSSLFAFKRGSECNVSDKAHITVSRRLPPGGCSSEYKFGTAYLKMSREFLSVLSSSSTASKCLKVSLDILNCDMEPKGSIAIFLRLSCFGLTIITQFQADSSSDNKAFSFRGDNFMPFDLGYSCPPDMSNNPQCGGMQVANNPSNASDKAKDELILDLLKVIKSSTMLNYMLNQYLIRGENISAPGVVSPYNVGWMSDNRQICSGMNFDKAPSNHSYPMYPPQPSRTQVHPGGFNTFFPRPQNCAQTFFTGNNVYNPLIMSRMMNTPYKTSTYPTYNNNMLTFEPNEPLSAAVSENILCKPETYLVKNNTAINKDVLPKMSPSRNSIVRHSPSRSAWYSTGGVSQAIICKRG